jgi:Na+-driven multidrug efflux pump
MTWALISACLFGIFLYLFATFLRLLREDHPDVYRELGSPSLLPKDPLSPDWSTAKFVWSGAYRKVGDARLSRLGVLLRLYVILFVLWCFWPLVA